MKTHWSLETSCGEKDPALFIYFGDDVRVKIGHDFQSFEDFIARLEIMLLEARETHGHEFP